MNYYQKVVEIVAELNKAGDHRFEIEEPTGYSVMVTLDGDQEKHLFFSDSKDKIRVFPRTLRYDGDNYPQIRTCSEIAFSASRDAQALANDIRKRLLTDFLRDYKTGVAEIAVLKARADRRLALFHKLKNELGGVSYNGNTKEMTVYLQTGKERLPVDLSVSDENSVSIKFPNYSTSAESATLIMKSLVAIYPPKRCRKCESPLKGDGKCTKEGCPYQHMDQKLNAVQYEARVLAKFVIPFVVVLDGRRRLVNKTEMTKDNRVMLKFASGESASLEPHYLVQVYE